MPSQSGLQQLVEAAGGIAAENKENASRKRGRDFVEMIAPAPKQVRHSVRLEAHGSIQTTSICQLIQNVLQEGQSCPVAWHSIWWSVGQLLQRVMRWLSGS